MTEDAKGTLDRAMALFRAGDKDTAIESLRQAVDSSDDDEPWLMVLLLNLAHLIGRHQGASEEVRALLYRVRHIADAVPEPDESLGMVLADLAVGFENVGDWSEARRHFERALEVLEEGHPKRVKALHSLVSGLRESDPTAARSYARLFVDDAERLPEGSFRFACLRLAAAQLYTELELAQGGVPDLGHLHSAIEVILREDSTFRVPDEIDALLRHVGAGPISGSRLAPAGRDHAKDGDPSEGKPSPDKS
jgi:tetratricopeptide (TPR) repeat protein